MFDNNEFIEKMVTRFETRERSNSKEFEKTFEEMFEIIESENKLENYNELEIVIELMVKSIEAQKRFFKPREQERLLYIQDLLKLMKRKLGLIITKENIREVYKKITIIYIPNAVATIYGEKVTKIDKLKDEEILDDLFDYKLFEEYLTCIKLVALIEY